MPEGNKTRQRIQTFPPIVTPLQFSVARFVPFGRLPWDIFFISFLSNAILRSKYESSSWKSIRTIENIFIKKSSFQFAIIFFSDLCFLSLNEQLISVYFYPIKCRILKWLWARLEKPPFLQSKPRSMDFSHFHNFPRWAPVEDISSIAFICHIE